MRARLSTVPEDSLIFLPRHGRQPRRREARSGDRALRAGGGGRAARAPSTSAPRPAASPQALLAHGAAQRARGRRRPRAAAPVAARRPARHLARGRGLEAAVARRRRGAVRLLHRRRQLRRRAQHAARPRLPTARRAPRASCWSSRSSSCPTAREGRGDVDDPRAAPRGAGEGARAAREALGFELAAARRLARRRRQRHRSRCSPTCASPGARTTLPQPGERAARRAPKRDAATRRGAPATLRWFAVVAPGLEEVAAREVAALPDARDVARRRRAASSGPARRRAATARTCGCAIATRVLARVGEVRSARVRQAAPPRRRAAVGARSSRRARRSPCAPARAAAASITRARWPRRRCWRSPTPSRACDAAKRRREPRRDGAGARRRRSLHLQRRRVGRAAAPPRRRAWRPAQRRCARRWPPGCWRSPAGSRRRALVDPMCGAGTIVDRGGDAGAGRAPGAERGVRDGALADCRRTPRPSPPAMPRCARRERGADAGAPAAARRPPIVGSDRDRAHDRERAPQRRARRRRRPHIDARLPRRRRRASARAARACVITNPPYGRRLGDARAAARGYRDLGRLLRAHFRGWRAAVVHPRRLDAERQLGLGRRAISASERRPADRAARLDSLTCRTLELPPRAAVLDGSAASRASIPMPPRRIRAAPPSSRTARGSRRRSPLARARARRTADRRAGRRAFRGCGEAPGPPPAEARRATAARTPASPTRAAAASTQPARVAPASRAAASIFGMS